MKSKKNLWISLIFLCFVFFAFSVKNDPFLKILNDLKSYAQKYPQEKIHLHLDKPYYVVGDDIWFKAYIIDSYQNATSDISSFVYVELIDERDSLSSQLKLPVLNGFASGDFKLPDSLNEGNYRIRAYTNYMRNWSAENFFQKSIRIGKLSSNQIVAQPNFSFQNNNVESEIKYLDKNGFPLKNKTIQYHWLSNNKNLKKGSVVTDESGVAKIKLDRKSIPSNAFGKLITYINLDGGNPILKSFNIPLEDAGVDIQFFPEGGTFTTNLPQMVAFKAVNSQGMAVKILGDIIDNNGKEVTKLESNELGMGSFLIIPNSNLKYSAKIKLPNGLVKQLNLPNHTESGFSLSLINLDSNYLQVKVLATADKLKQGEIKVVAQQRGQIVYVGKTVLDKQFFQSKIPKDKLPAGVVQFTLFSAENLPIAERLYFHKKSSQDISIDIDSNNLSKIKRGTSSITIAASNKSVPIEGSFSISITNANKVVPDEFNESNIYSSLLLASDLKGFIQSPNYYFSENNSKVSTDLDLLMLTQGYRHFIWNDIHKDLPISFKPEKDLAISGIVLSSKKPSVGAKVTLFSNQDGFFLQTH